MAELSKEEKLQQLDRVIQSATLHGSDSLRAFLRFVGLKAIEDQDGQLKEYVIASEVLGRGDDYDSRIDSVVRVQAGRLRTRLREYYASEGKNDKILIELPKGHYTPVFSPASSESAVSRADRVSNYEAEETAKSDLRSQLAPLWGEVLRAPEPLLVVFSNTIFHGTYETGMRLHHGLTLFEESTASSESMGQAEQPVLPMINHYTGIGEAMGIYLLSEFFAKVGHSFRVKRSLLLSWDDAKTENIVALGSPAENLFLKDLPQQQDFVFRPLNKVQPNNWLGIINTNPQPGEPEYYTAKQFGPSPSQISEDYALVSLLKGLSENNRLMILAGINTFGTQAAVEYVTQPKYIKDLISHLNIAPPGEPPQLPDYYQILLKVKVNGGVPIHVSYVIHHVLDQ